MDPNTGKGYRGEGAKMKPTWRVHRWRDGYRYPGTKEEALSFCRQSRGRFRLEYHGPRPLVSGDPSDWTGRVLVRESNV